MLEKLVAGALLALTLGACAILQPEEKVTPPAGAPPNIELTKQQGGRFIAFTGPQLQHTGPFLGVSDTNFFLLRSWLDNKTGEVAHQVYVEDSYYGGPFNWTGAHDADNAPLKFIAISRNEISCEQGCSYADEFAAALPDSYLKSHQDGLAVTFTAGNGKALTVKVPGDLVTAQVNAIEAVRTMAAKPADSATAEAATAEKPAAGTAGAKPADKVTESPATLSASPAPVSQPLAPVAQAPVAQAPVAPATVAASAPAAPAPVSAPPAIPPGTIVPAPPEQK